MLLAEPDRQNSSFTQGGWLQLQLRDLDVGYVSRITVRMVGTWLSG
jgi:hypothetical protein